ncbi:MAG TPA: hypothetical protein PKV72_06655, partial [Candidatus Peribacteria bacterium]|nr:hypothetical protein [Candidatus Peribacteria bacterium]
MKTSRVIAGFALACTLWSGGASAFAQADQFAPAQPPEGITNEEYSVAVVQRVIDEVEDDAYGFKHSTQHVKMR